ncbi:MAG TPA: hypothetical protein VM266_02120 [Solirubrobacteraceae bacterium]|nr:hypothetical protein [Solirubrobacteraceae bacterium]
MHDHAPPETATTADEPQRLREPGAAPAAAARAAAAGRGLSADGVLGLQPAVGNRALSRLVAGRSLQRQTDDDEWDDDEDGRRRRGGRGTRDRGRSHGAGERSRQSRPRDAPSGTVPIDQSGLSREDIHKIKRRIGAGAADWVGITPDGHVVTTDENGNTVDHGHKDDLLARQAEPAVDPATGRRLRSAATGALIGAGIGTVLGGIGGAILGAGGGTLVAPGVGTVGGGVAGAVAGAEAGAFVGTAAGAAIGGLIGWFTGD